MKTALITGFTGQDGTFLTELLLGKGYRVIGLTRRVSTEPPRRVRGRFDFSQAIEDGQLILADGDLSSVSSLMNILRAHQPHEVYNLAWQSHVGLSFKMPEISNQDYAGYVNLITAVQAINPAVRVYQASTSEMFGDRDITTPINEATPLRPNSPYAIAKTAAHYYGIMKRKQGMFIANGILFNHESEIRGGNFVTQKIAQGAKQWAKTGEPIKLGNLDAKRDWGYAGDYVEGMWRMLQHDTPDDFILATGETHTVRDFATMAFKAVGIKISWEGLSESEVGHSEDGLTVMVDPQFYRPNEVGFLLGDPTKAKADLGWEPKHNFESLVKLMVN